MPRCLSLGAYVDEATILTLHFDIGQTIRGKVQIRRPNKETRFETTETKSDLIPFLQLCSASDHRILHPNVPIDPMNGGKSMSDRALRERGETILYIDCGSSGHGRTDMPASIEIQP